MTIEPRGESPRRALVTIRSSREIDGLFNRGAHSANDLLTVFVADSPPRFAPTGRLAFIAGKKLGNSVARNRAKRVLREAARRSGGPWSGRDVALIARPSLYGAPSDRIDASVRRLLGRLGVRS